jgi:hypothetical protein
MVRAIGYVTGSPIVAIAGAYLIFGVWDTLIRQEIVPGYSLAGFPAIAVRWDAISLVQLQFCIAGSQDPVPYRERMLI